MSPTAGILDTERTGVQGVRWAEMAGWREQQGDRCVLAGGGQGGAVSIVHWEPWDKTAPLGV